ncbi:MAG: putative toxin-antitoxin system toxin component, PIN family [Burkholderiaceae bacterium]|nr:putative toxin-antitoxin system toxin component, PIN family [Burkholderiaceae bacterium]
MIPPTLVLDTNICLDLFVFRDPRWAALMAALEQGSVRAITRSDCRAEWLAVLNYPKLKLDSEAQAACATRFDALIACKDKPEVEPARPTLPKCSDGDDQKFLELAFDEKADVLISKDKALLKLAKRNVKHGLFPILSPEAWHQNEERSFAGISAQIPTAP